MFTQMSGNYFVLKFQPLTHILSAQRVGLCGSLNLCPSLCIPREAGISTLWFLLSLMELEIRIFQSVPMSKQGGVTERSLNNPVREGPGTRAW